MTKIRFLSEQVIRVIPQREDAVYKSLSMKFAIPLINTGMTGVCKVGTIRGVLLCCLLLSNKFSISLNLIPVVMVTSLFCRLSYAMTNFARLHSGVRFGISGKINTSPIFFKKIKSLVIQHY